MSEAAKWYVIHTYSGYENKVAQNIEKVVENRKLHDLIQEVKVPTEKAMEKNDKDVLREVERKVFPGYVLVKMILTDDSWYVVRNTRGVTGYVLLKMVCTDDSWYVVRNTRGCTGFVGPASEPTPLSDEEVEQLFGIEVSSVEVNFKEGDRVRISGTAMDGFTGIVQSINLDDKTVDVLVSMFGRETPTTLSLSQVVSAED